MNLLASGTAPFGVYPVGDGFVIIACLDNQWPNLCNVVGRLDMVAAPEARRSVDDRRLADATILHHELSPQPASASLACTSREGRIALESGWAIRVQNLHSFLHSRWQRKIFRFYFNMLL